MTVFNLRGKIMNAIDFLITGSFSVGFVYGLAMLRVKKNCILAGVVLTEIGDTNFIYLLSD